VILIFPGGKISRDIEVLSVLVTDYDLTTAQAGEIVRKPEVLSFMMSIKEEYWDPESFVHEIEQNGDLDEAYEAKAEAYSEWG
jgi:hypothetical protein